MASMASRTLAAPAATRAGSRRARGTATRPGGKTRGFGAHETWIRFSNVRASRPRRRTNPNAAVSAVAGLFGRGASPDTVSLAAIEAEIDAAAPASSTAGTTQLSLADAVWKVSREIPLSLRDRAACAVAAEATQALCETGLDGAGLAVTLAILEALRRNGLIDGFAADDDDDARSARTGPKEAKEAKHKKIIRARAGYRAGDVSADGAPSRAVPHAWLELDGRVLDVCTDGLALCEAARRASVDYSDTNAMQTRFGDDALRLGGHAPNARPPLTVLNVPVPVGGTRTVTVPVRLTLRDPPSSVPDAAQSTRTVAGYRAALRACAGADAAACAAAVAALVDEMPSEVKAVFHRVASVKLDVVGDEKARVARLGE
jgi:hypothetical protein